MTDQHQMHWHANASWASDAIKYPLLLAILGPIILIGAMFGIGTAYYHNFVAGLQVFGVVFAASAGLFGLSFLISRIIRPKGIRTGFVMNEEGVVSFTDDEVAQAIIAAGGMMGVATANPTMAATPLTATAGKFAQILWRDVEYVLEKPSQNSLVLKKGRKTLFVIYANEQNYVDVRSFIKRHLKETRSARGEGG